MWAVQRMVASTSQDLRHCTTYRRGYLLRLYEEVVGVCGEIAVAKFKGVWFSPLLNTFHYTPDCLGYEVRATDRVEGRLIVRENDADDRKYILATTDGSDVILVGWLFGGEAKQDRWRSNPNDYRECWMVPQKFLHPMADLDKPVQQDSWTKPTT